MNRFHSSSTHWLSDSLQSLTAHIRGTSISVCSSHKSRVWLQMTYFNHDFLLYTVDVLFLLWDVSQHVFVLNLCTIKVRPCVCVFLPFLCVRGISLREGWMSSLSLLGWKVPLKRFRQTSLCPKQATNNTQASCMERLKKITYHNERWSNTAVYWGWQNNSGKAEDIESWGGGGGADKGPWSKTGKKLELGYMRRPNRDHFVLVRLKSLATVQRVLHRFSVMGDQGEGERRCHLFVIGF